MSAETAVFFWPEGEGESFAVRSKPFSWGVAAQCDLVGGVAFVPLGSAPPGGEGGTIVVERLGAQLPTWEDADLLSVLLRGFFGTAASELPVETRSNRYRLYFPPWMGPRERRLVREAAQNSGLTVLEGLERGLAPALTQFRRGKASESGGWVVADRCGSDLDLYAIAEEPHALRSGLSLTCYRQCSELFSPYFVAREQEAASTVLEALRNLPTGWPLLTTDGETATLLRGMVRTGSPVEEVSFAQHLAGWIPRTEDERPTSHVSRKWRYWLDHGDARLDPLTADGESFPCRFERLFDIPDPPPQQLYLGLRAGFSATRRETHEVCRMVLSRPHDFHFAPGQILVRAALVAPDRGELAVEVLQHAKQVHVQRVEFPS